MLQWYSFIKLAGHTSNIRDKGGFSHLHGTKDWGSYDLSRQNHDTHYRGYFFRRWHSLMRGKRRRPIIKAIAMGLMGDLGLMGWMGKMGLVVVNSLAVDWVSVWVVA